MGDAPAKPAVIWRPSPNHGPRGGRAVDCIILHHTGGSSAAGALAELRRQSGRRVSAHYLINPLGIVYQLVDDARAAWHAGRAELDGDPHVNARSIGIELVNPGDGVTPFPPAQIDSLVALLCHLCHAYSIPPQRVLGHRDVAPGRKADPADNFPWEAVLARL